MFQRLFGRERSRNRQIVEALYEQIVAAARREFLYSDLEVPDTPLGRFEMLSLHMFLLQHRLKGQQGIAAEIAQELIDEFFKELDHSIRELGVSDVGVPKRMKKLSRMFYGRTAAYGAALDAGSRSELAAALARNVRPDARDWPQVGSLADHVFDLYAALQDLSIDAICAGELVFPSAVDRGVSNEAEVQR